MSNLNPEEEREQVEAGPGGTEAVSNPNWFAGGWIAPTVVVVFTIVWSLIIYGLVGNRTDKRDWKYGVAPYVPAQSIFSSELSRPAKTPNQVAYPEEP